MRMASNNQQYKSSSQLLEQSQSYSLKYAHTNNIQVKRGNIDNQMNQRQPQNGSLGRQVRQSLDINTNVPLETYHRQQQYSQERCSSLRGSKSPLTTNDQLLKDYETEQSQEQDDFLRDVLECRKVERDSLSNDFNYLFDKIHRIKEKINSTQYAAGDITTSTKPFVRVPSVVRQEQRGERNTCQLSPPLQSAEIIQPVQISPLNQLSAEQISANEMLSKWLELPSSQLNGDINKDRTQQNQGNEDNMQENVKTVKLEKKISQTHKKMQDLLSEMNVDYLQILPEIDQDAQNNLTQVNYSTNQSSNIVVLDDISIINIQKLIITKLSKKVEEIKAEKEEFAQKILTQKSSYLANKQSPAMSQ